MKLFVQRLKLKIISYICWAVAPLLSLAVFTRSVHTHIDTFAYCYRVYLKRFSRFICYAARFFDCFGAMHFTQFLSRSVALAIVLSFTLLALASSAHVIQFLMRRTCSTASACTAEITSATVLFNIYSVHSNILASVVSLPRLVCFRSPLQLSFVFPVCEKQIQPQCIEVRFCIQNTRHMSIPAVSVIPVNKIYCIWFSIELCFTYEMRNLRTHSESTIGIRKAYKWCNGMRRCGIMQMTIASSTAQPNDNSARISCWVCKHCIHGTPAKSAQFGNLVWNCVYRFAWAAILVRSSACARLQRIIACVCGCWSNGSNNTPLIWPLNPLAHLEKLRSFNESAEKFIFMNCYCLVAYKIMTRTETAHITINQTNLLRQCFQTFWILVGIMKRFVNGN